MFSDLSFKFLTCFSQQCLKDYVHKKIVKENEILNNITTSVC